MLVMRPLPVIVALIAQIVILPLIAYQVATFFNLRQEFFIGLVLIACCPGGSSSNIFSLLAKGDVALSVSLTALSSIITLFTLPAIMDYVSAAQASTLGGHVTFNVGSLIMQNVVLMLLPIVLGLLSQRYLPNFSKKADSVLRKIAFPALMLLAGIFFVQHRETIIANFGEVGLVNSTMFLGATVAAALLCLLFRFSGAVRKTIVIEVGMQNAAQAIAVASSPFVFNNDMIAVPAIVYALLMNVFLLSYVAIANQLSKD